MHTHYKAIPIGEEKPESDKRYFCILKDGSEKHIHYSCKIGFYSVLDNFDGKNVTHWLKPVNPVEALIEKWQTEIDSYEKDLAEYAELGNTSLCEEIQDLLNIRYRFINDLKSI